MRALKLLVAAALLLVVLVGCGGGGGGTPPSPATVTGRVVWIETGSAPSPAATVTAGGATASTDVVDGSFSIQVPVGTTSLTVSYTATGSSAPVVRSFTFPAATSGGSSDVGDLYIGPQTVKVRGSVVDVSNGAAIVGAQVSMAGRNATTQADGSFELVGVAYSDASLAVFLGLQGEVTATSYFAQFFSPPSGAVAGVVDVGPLELTAVSSGTPPGLPYNVDGTVLPAADGAGAKVELISGTTAIRTTTADGAGKFQFWAPAGAYTVKATKGSLTGTASLTVLSTGSVQTVSVTLH